MPSAKIPELVSQLSSKCSKAVYNALVCIRTKVIKEKHGLSQLLKSNAFDKIGKILSDADVRTARITDVVLSILGNVCMDKTARQEVKSVGGIHIVGTLLCETDSESIQNRAARTLANLALDIDNLKAIQLADVFSTVINLLEKTTNKECQLTYCRALRLFGQQKETVHALLKDNAAEILARLVRKGNNEVAEPALRTLYEYSKYCNSEFVAQLIAAKAVDDLMPLINGEDPVLSQYSFTIFLRISSESTARPELGRVGAITCFRDMILNDSRKNKTLEILSAFCLLCRESVNRERMICNEGLELLMDCLRSDKYKLLHDRIISAIVCFIFDKSGLRKLLDLGLVQALMPHLERAAGYQCRKFDDFNFPSPGENCPRKEQDSVATHFTKTGASYDEVVEDVMQASTVSMEKLPKKQTSKATKRKAEIEELNLDNKPVSEDIRSEIEIDNSSKRLKLHSGEDGGERLSAEMNIEHQDDNAVQSDNLPETQDLNLSAELQENTQVAGKISKNHVYSIDSPTYEANNDWNLEEYSKGMKCKTSFLPLNVNMTPPRDRPYSPMSNSSLNYFSPGWLSPSSSIPSEDSYDSLDEIYGTGSSTPSWCILSSSSYDSDVEASSQGYNSSEFYTPSFSSPDFSDTECESITDSESETEVCNTESDLHPADIQSRCLNQENSPASKEMASSLLVEDASGSAENLADTSGNSGKSETDLKDDTIMNNGCNEITPNKKSTPSYTNSTCSEKNVELHSENMQDISEFEEEHSIKKKLSRVVLPTENNILMLLSRISLVTEFVEYLVNVETISSLLEYISEVEIPMSRAERILLRIIKDPNCFVSLINMVAPALIYHRLAATQCDSRITNISNIDLDRDILTSSFPEESQDVLPDGKCCKITNVRSYRSFQGSKVQVYHKSPSLACRFFIHELRVMASSPFGQGELSHWMLTKEGLKKDKGAVCLLFLTRNIEMKQKYMMDMGGMKCACNVLLQQNDALLFQYAAYGIQFLARIHPDGLLHLKCKTELLFSPVSKHKFKSMPKCDNDLLDCNYIVDHDVVFLLAENQKIPANRDAMATNSAVFSAMLEGHYAESSQSVVRISDAPLEAMKCIVHYLHNCTLSCTIMNSLFSTSCTLELCLDVVALADRYLLESLKSVICGTICQIHLNMETVVCVFQFAIDHNLLPLAKDCILFVLLSKEKNVNILRVIVELMRSSYAEQFVDTLIRLLSGRLDQDCL